tara:strand:+ start:563 stop:937 length:375 start_codon:yes stop_codon:yes gene_type:complete
MVELLERIDKIRNNFIDEIKLNYDNIPNEIKNLYDLVIKIFDGCVPKNIGDIDDIKKFKIYKENLLKAEKNFYDLQRKYVAESVKYNKKNNIFRMYKLPLIIKTYQILNIININIEYYLMSSKL